MTQLFTTIASLRHYLNNQKSKKNIGQPLANVSVGLIPTMGALHTGHLSLIDRARKENVCVVVSIFAIYNPDNFLEMLQYDSSKK